MKNNFPSIAEFRRGVIAFRKREKRDAMYKVATKLIKDSWGNHQEVADGLGVLLLTWNNALYRYGIFDFDKLEKFLSEHHKEVNAYSKRNLLDWVEQDDSEVKVLFDKLMGALISKGKDKKLRRSPVAVAKAWHLLAPEFFPLWDGEIARSHFIT